MADTDAMHELAEFFFSQADQEMADLSKALNAGSAQEVRRLAHRLLGASAGCGMFGMVPPVTELEQQAKQGDLANAGELLARLAGLLEQCRSDVALWRASIHSE